MDNIVNSQGSPDGARVGILFLGLSRWCPDRNYIFPGASRKSPGGKYYSLIIHHRLYWWSICSTQTSPWRWLQVTYRLHCQPLVGRLTGFWKTPSLSTTLHGSLTQGFMWNKQRYLNLVDTMGVTGSLTNFSLSAFPRAKEAWNNFLVLETCLAK